MSHRHVSGVRLLPAERILDGRHWHLGVSGKQPDAGERTGLRQISPPVHYLTVVRLLLLLLRLSRFGDGTGAGDIFKIVPRRRGGPFPAPWRDATARYRVAAANAAATLTTATCGGGHYWREVSLPCRWGCG